MFKKIALIGAVATMLVSSAASATGLYVGAGLGYQNAIRETTINLAGALGTFNNLYNDRDFGQSASGQIFLGYGLCLSQNFWIGLEVNGELSDARTNTNQTLATPAGGGTIVTAYNTRYRYRGGFGVSVRPGYFTSDQTKLYAVVGWQHGRVDSTFSDTTTILGGAPLQATTIDSRWLDGFRFGGGIETNFTNQLGGRMEFTQTRYGSYNWSLPAGFATGSVANLSEKPYTNELTASLIWTIGDIAHLDGAMGIQ